MFRPKSIQHHVTTTCACGAQLRATSYLNEVVAEAHKRFLDAHWKCRQSPVNPAGEEGESYGV